MTYTPKQKAEWALGRYLSMRPRSEQEVRRYLDRTAGRYGVTPEDIESLIQKYRHLGYIDDKKYVESMTHAILDTKKRGPSILRMKLTMAGVAPDLIAQSVAAISREQMVQGMEKRLQKYRGKLSQLDHNVRSDKAFQILFSSGFSSSSIRPFLDEWLKKEYHTST